MEDKPEINFHGKYSDDPDENKWIESRLDNGTDNFECSSYIVQQLEERMPDQFTIRFAREPEGGWFAKIMEFPGCMSQGDDLQDTFDMILDAASGWLESFDNFQKKKKGQ